MGLLRQRSQLAAAIGTEGTAPTWSNVEAAANAAIELYDFNYTPNIGRFDRNPLRSQMGRQISLPTTRQAQMTFRVPARGSGTAGTAPKIGPLLRACAMSQTINTGSAAVGSVSRDNSISTGPTLAFTVAGTFTGTESGQYRIVVTAASAATSIDCEVFFIPGDGTGATLAGSLSALDATTPQSIGSGLTLVLDSIAPITTENVGDQYVFNATSDQQVDVTYEPQDIDTSHAVVDLSILENGRVRRMYSARGTWRLTGNLGEPIFFEFTFTGIPVSDADTSLLTGISFETTVPPIFQGLGSLDMFGITTSGSSCFTQVSVELGNNVVMVPCAAAATGFITAKVTDRNMTGSFDPVAELVATRDFFDKLIGTDVDDFTFQVGSTSGNIIKFESTRAQVISLGEGERDGLLVDNVGVLFTQPEYDAGGDYAEAKIIFS